VDANSAEQSGVYLSVDATVAAKGEAMVKRFRSAVLRSRSAIKVTDADEAGAKLNVPKPRRFRVFFIGYLLMWFVGGMVLELAGLSLRERRRIGLQGQQIAECVSLVQWLTFTHGAAPICG
jgi:hypothetical protein